jgi:hypothetical protein
MLRKYAILRRFCEENGLGFGDMRARGSRLVVSWRVFKPQAPGAGMDVGTRSWQLAWLAQQRFSPAHCLELM